jgi:hypothetical protein
LGNRRPAAAKIRWKRCILERTIVHLLTFLALPSLALASDGGGAAAGALADTFWRITALVIFVLAYSLVPLENNIRLRKSKPVLLAAGIIWVLLAIADNRIGDTHTAHVSLQKPARIRRTVSVPAGGHDLHQRHGRSQRLRDPAGLSGLARVLVAQDFLDHRRLTFVISPIADNLTTALLMGAVVMAVGDGDKGFIALACINIVVAANAAGAFSPFGDITNLMV